MSIHLSTKPHYGIKILIALCLLFTLLAINTNHAYANTVTINDLAGVLDSGKVHSDAAHLPVSILIYTTNTFTGDQAALDTDARSHLSGTNIVDIAIDTVQRHLSIQSGSQVKLSDEQASNAVDAFRNTFNNGDYTGATVAAIDSIHDTLTTGGMTKEGIVLGTLLLIGLVFILVFAIVKIVRNRRYSPPTGGRRNQKWNDDKHSSYPHPLPIDNAAATHANPNSYHGGGSNFGGGGSFGGGAGGSF